MKSLRVVNINAFYLLILLFCLLPNGSAAEDEYANIPLPGQFSPALQDDGSVKYVTAIAIEKKFRTHSPQLQKLLHNRKISRFIVAEHSWLDDLLLAYNSLLSSFGISAEQDTWDCENYSSMLNNLATLRIWHAGYLDTRAAIGWIRVVAKKKWAGYQGGIHAVMFAVTGEGIFIIEPQNGQYVPLSAYPNRGLIEEVYLF